ncbi:MAG: tetratricopeptide repeat protein [Prevotella sp.]|nr:tetratricopeptide repeat protein [Prevotella sp.]
MKRGVSLLIICFLTIIGMAQTQQGVVKTRGKMVNGKHVPGQGLSGATVTIQGRSAVLSQTNGAFSFPTTSKTFMVQGVKKTGYQLVDPDATRKAYQYSPNIFYIIMETPDQQAEDRLAIERKIRRTLQKQLQQREDELEEQKEMNKLTQEEYHKALQQLYDDQQNNERLIADMAKEYAQMDYDQMDELNRQISDAILNGELTKADSLLRSKGDISSRISEVRKAQKAEAQREAEIAREQEELAASKEGTKKRLEDLAQDCKNFFDRFKMANQHDSAAYYIELRAELDTTNADWQFDAGFHFRNQNQYRKSEFYYERALVLYQQLAVSNPEAYDFKKASVQNNLAGLYYNTQRLSDAERMFVSALDTYQRLAKSDPETNDPKVAKIQSNLTIMYSDANRFDEAEKMCKSSLETLQRLAASNPDAFEGDLADTQTTLAYLYSDTQRSEAAEHWYFSALEIYQRLVASNPEIYESRVAMTMNSLGFLYNDTQKYAEAEKMYLSALEIYERLVASNPESYEPDFAMTQNNLANTYYNTQRYAEAEKAYFS